MEGGIRVNNQMICDALIDAGLFYVGLVFVRYGPSGARKNIFPMDPEVGG